MHVLVPSSLPGSDAPHGIPPPQSDVAAWGKAAAFPHGFPHMATFIHLCFRALALFGCDDNGLHAMMVHGITDWALVIGLVLEQLPTNKKFMSPWWMKTKMANIVGYIKGILSMAVLKMASKIAKGTKWVFNIFFSMLMRKVLWSVIRCGFVRFVEIMSPYALHSRYFCG